MKNLNSFPLGATLALTVMLVTAPVLAFKPTQESGHIGIVRNGLARIAVPSADGVSTYRFSERAILEVRDSTAGVDEIVSARGEISEPRAHCDDELLPECTQRIIDIKNTVIGLLAQDPPDGTEARRQIGRALHTLQDFLSHSNWINLSGASPGLGSRVIGRLGPSFDTCLRGPSTDGSGTLAAYGLSTPTTGYFSLVMAPPDGKCNHGLLIDPGIHKDEPGRPGHPAARAAAVDATESLIRQVLAAPAIAGNDAAIRAFLDVRGAVGFVVDDTGSMGGVIAGVKASIGKIVTEVRNAPAPPDRYVLVNFGDPTVGTPFVTVDAGALLARANGLSAGGGGDCPELSMSGTLRAVNASPPGSQLWVFTDASAKDSALASNVVTQANAKKITISFHTFGSCSPIDPAYYMIAAETGGQLYALERTSTETEKIFALTTPYLSGSPKPVLVANGQVGGARNLDFMADGAMRTLLVSVSLESGATARLYRPGGAEALAGSPGVAVTQLSGGKLFAVTAPASGSWRLSLAGSGRYDVSVAGDSSVELNRFEFVETRGRDGHTGLFPLKSQPLAGAPQTGRATVLGKVSTAQFSLVDEAGATISALDTTGAGASPQNDEYIASFTLPPQKFRIMVKGKLPSGQAYQRILPQLFFGRTVKVEASGGGYGVYTPGSSHTIRFKVSNLGAPDTFEAIAADERGFITGTTPANFTLGSNQSRLVEISVTIPASAPSGTVNTVSLVAKGASSANGTVMVQVISASAITGDIDRDGDVDRDDMAIIFTARNTAASGSSDPRDLDRDGQITVLDGRQVSLICSRPACARE